MGKGIPDDEFGLILHLLAFFAAGAFICCRRVASAISKQKQARGDKEG